MRSLGKGHAGRLGDTESCHVLPTKTPMGPGAGAVLLSDGVRVPARGAAYRCQ